MQKKIYPLFHVPCFLALCLALVLLASCGGESEPTPQPPAKPNNPNYVPPIPVNPDSRVVIEDVDKTIFGGKLKVTGRVDLMTSDASIKISNIEITLKNLENNISKPIPLERPGSDFGDGVSFQNLQPDGLEFNGNTCDYSKGRVQISVRVYISTKPNEVAAGVDLEPFDATPEGCKDRTLTLTVDPTACTGSVTSNPPGPSYRDGTSVTVTANPCSGYEFQRWSDGPLTEWSASTYTFTITGNKNLQANYVKNYTLVKDQANSKNYLKDEVIMGYVKYTGSDLVAQNNAKIVEWFMKDDGTSDQIGHDPAQLGPLPESPSTARFTPAVGRDEDDIGYTVNYFFLVKTTYSGGWESWYLMHGTNCPGVGAGVKCTAVTVWRVGS
ncbi:MAG: hypothetical protein LBC64_06415 [Fibromonadaceae bacterium]|jgi:hypothetical protein|nr:hypothetical protein [Fibromonadaceae bacterium]